MAGIHGLLFMEGFHEEEEEVVPRRTRKLRTRADPMKLYNEREFKRRFRMTKDNVLRLSNLIKHHLEKENNRGHPLLPLQQLLLCLHHLGSASFQRATGDTMGVTQFGAWVSIVRVYDAILLLEPDFLTFPDAAEQAGTAMRMLERFKIPRLSLAIDGTHIRFEEAPRGFPDNLHTKKMYTNRKNYDSINLMVIANDRRICAIDSRWPGSAHDSRVWNMCSAKPIIEEQNDYFIVGDSAYGISEVLTKPFSERELNNEVDQARRRRKILFNRRLCGARTVMSENIYATLKRRWPVLKNMRHHMKLAQKAIKVVCILENICREWNDDLPEDEEDIADDNGDNTDNRRDNDGAEDRELQKIRGKAKRLHLLGSITKLHNCVRGRGGWVPK